MDRRDATPAHTVPAGTLAFDDVCAGYGQGTVIEGVTFDVPRGEVTCLLGRNGVGKSTLLRTAMGLLEVTRGRIFLGGADLTTQPTYRRARAGLGYVPQGRGVFPRLTVRENLLMGLEADPAGPIGGDARLEPIYMRFPVLATMANRMAGALSGGQQQQLAIGRALVRNPSVLILDEPTEGIQPNIIDEIEETIRELRDTGTLAILLVEQFLDFAVAVANRCVVMEKGRVIAQGTPEEIGGSVLRESLSV